jgi:serine/threonine protein kinase
VKSKRLHEVEALYRAALEREPAERRAFLAEACAGDEELRQEVQSLLAYDERAERFLETPAMQVEAKAMVMDRCSSEGTKPALAIGQRLGSLEVTALMGRGGMGEVYRARDTKLKRDVAIKILPEEFSRDPDRLSRFQREAEVLASLNHPNIAAIYDLQQANDTRFLMLELVEGETLADRIARGPVPVQEALHIARNICEALEAAHEKGIIHRDLKPANVKLTAAGQVKVLDFGLAKIGDARAATDFSNSPTLLSASVPGAILGTAAYMSPEQARARPVDKRTDIWALGVVVYEMLTGKQAFAGEIVTDTLASILRGEPDWVALRSLGGSKIDAVLRRCLQKDPNRRWRDIGDVRMEIEDALARPPTAELASPQQRLPVWIPWAVAIVLAAAAVIGWMRPAATTTMPSKLTLTIVPPAGTVLRPVGSQTSVPEISPDGLSVFYRSQGELYVRRLDSLRPELVRGSQAMSNAAFWSADSRLIVFPTRDGLIKIRVPDGAPETIGGLTRYGYGGTWSDRGTILISGAPPPGTPGILRLYAAPPGNGELKSVDVTELKPGDYFYPEFLPGTAEDFLFFSYPNNPTAEVEGGEVYLATLRGGKAVRPTFLMRNDTAVRYTPSGGGRVLFVRNDNLYSQRLNLVTRKLEGDSELIQEGVASSPSPTFRADFSVSRSGIVAWRPGKAALSQVTMFDRQGTEIGKAGPPSVIESIFLAPDDSRLLAQAGDRTWLLDYGQQGRLSLGAWEWLWSPDGSRLVGQDVRGRLAERSIVGSGEVHETGDAPGILQAISPDGKEALFQEGRSTVVSVRLDSTPRERAVRTVIKADGLVEVGTFSPDAHWIVYSLLERGATSAGIFVQPFPGPGLRRQVGSGTLPIWRKDGKEIIYHDGPNTAATLWSVRVESAGEGLRFSAPQKLFSGIQMPAAATASSRPLAVSRDGTRIFIPQALEQPDSNLIHVKLFGLSAGDTKK